MDVWAKTAKKMSEIAWKDFGQNEFFLDGPEISGLSGKFTDCLESFQMVWIFFPDDLESFQIA